MQRNKQEEAVQRLQEKEANRQQAAMVREQVSHILILIQDLLLSIFMWSHETIFFPPFSNRMFWRTVTFTSKIWYVSRCRIFAINKVTRACNTSPKLVLDMPPYKMLRKALIVLAVVLNQTLEWLQFYTIN